MVIEFAVLGDSITTGRESTLALGISTNKSYVPWVAQGPEVHFAGGYAASGKNTYEIYTQATRVKKPSPKQADDADVCVHMSGTNDMSNDSLSKRIDRYRTQKYMLRAIDTVHSEHTLLLGIPPMVGWEEEVLDFNDWLSRVADVNGLVFHDPWVNMRDENGCWLEGMAQSDGRHQTLAATKILAQEIRNKLAEIMGVTLPPLVP